MNLLGMNSFAILTPASANSSNPFEDISNFLITIGNSIRPYAFSAAAIVVIILGFMLILGSSRQREQIKSHFKIIIIGLLIVLGAPTIAGFFKDQSANVFGNGDMQKVIEPMVIFARAKLHI